MDQRLGRRERAAEDFGNLLVTQILLAAEQDGAALVLGQGGHGIGDLLGQFPVQQAVRRRGAGLVLNLVARLVLAVRVRLVQRLGRVPRPPAELVQAEIAGDGEEPGGELGGLDVAGARFVYLQKDILRQVLRLGLVPQGAVDEVHDRLLVFPDQLGESRAVAALDAQHENSIGIEWYGHVQPSVANPGRTERFRCPARKNPRARACQPVSLPAK